jgi:hypothetical protein
MARWMGARVLMVDRPTDEDRARAALILDHVERLRDLGEYAGRDTRAAEIHFVACMLRNERLGLSDSRTGKPSPAAV